MSFLRRLRGEPAGAPKPAQEREVAAIYMGLRGAVLSLDPSSVGIHPTPDMANVWGLVMDWSLDRGVATIISLADGTTSMYLSTGGGSIGAGAHQAAAAASIKALHIAESMIDDFLPAQNAPVPAPARTALTLLTFSGLRRIEEDNTAFEKGTTRLSVVANAMQDVIHEIHLTEALSKGQQ